MGNEKGVSIYRLYSFPRTSYVLSVTTVTMLQIAFNYK